MPFLPVLVRKIDGGTRWKMDTPLRLLERVLVKAAQSMGEWPGERRTLLRAFAGVGMVVVVVRPPFARCWLFGGGPRLGSGPVEGMRRDAVVFGGGGRAGGGMRLAALRSGAFGVELGGGGMDVTSRVPFAGGEVGRSVFFACDTSSTAWLVAVSSKEKVGM